MSLRVFSPPPLPSERGCRSFYTRVTCDEGFSGFIFIPNGKVYLYCWQWGKRIAEYRREAIGALSIYSFINVTLEWELANLLAGASRKHLYGIRGGYPLWSYGVSPHSIYRRIVIKTITTCTSMIFFCLITFFITFLITFFKITFIVIVGSGYGRWNILEVFLLLLALSCWKAACKQLTKQNYRHKKSSDEQGLIVIKQKKIMDGHVGMVLITMRRYIECGDTPYEVLSHAGSPCIATFWKYCLAVFLSL